MEYRMIDCRDLTINDEEAFNALCREGWNPDVTDLPRLYLSPQTARPNIDVIRKYSPALRGWIILEVTNEQHEVSWLHMHFDHGSSEEFSLPPGWKR